ncbi:YwiC-like family protein [Ursidibacter sp. B-7004-1]
MFKEKPIISNQHGALVMAFVPFLYGIFASHFIVQHIFFGLSWLFLYFCSYPFLAIFNRKNNTKYKKWAIIYAVISLLFAIPVFFYKIAILQFSLFILPLVIIQIYYAKKKDERNLINDIAGILTFGIIGMASYYLPTDQYQWWILLHPTLFFIVTTLYVKSVARERKNPLYLKLSLFSHLLCVGIYLLFNQYSIAFAYFIALLRAIIVPKKQLNIKQVGILEFGVVFIFLLALLIC